MQDERQDRETLETSDDFRSSTLEADQKLQGRTTLKEKHCPVDYIIMSIFMERPK